MIRLTGMALACFSLCLLGAQNEDAAKKATEALQGEWQAVSGVMAGKQAPEELIKKFRLTFKEDTMIAVNGKEVKFKLDPSSTPNGIDFFPKTGPAMGKKIPGIYKLEKGQLTICSYNSGGVDQPRPNDFQVEEGEKQFLLVLKRVAPE